MDDRRDQVGRYKKSSDAENKRQAPQGTVQDVVVDSDNKPAKGASVYADNFVFVSSCLLMEY